MGCFIVAFIVVFILVVLIKMSAALAFLGLLIYGALWVLGICAVVCIIAWLISLFWGQLGFQFKVLVKG